MEAKPESAPAVCVIDTDCEVEFADDGSSSATAVVGSTSAGAVIRLTPDVPEDVVVAVGDTAYLSLNVPLMTPPTTPFTVTLTITVRVEGRVRVHMCQCFAWLYDGVKLWVCVCVSVLQTQTSGCRNSMYCRLCHRRNVV